MDLKIPPLGRRVKFEELLTEKDKQVADTLNDAKKRGANPQIRAEEANRPWKHGDGF